MSNIDYTKPLQIKTVIGWDNIEYLAHTDTQLSYKQTGELYTDYLEDINIRNKPLTANTKSIILSVFRQQQRSGDSDWDCLETTLNILEGKGVLRVEDYEFISGQINLEDL